MNEPNIMRNTFSYLAVIASVTALVSGCTNMQQKLGRGCSNTFEIVRMGELRRSMEQSSLFDSPDTGRSTGFVTGLCRTVERTGIGVYEIVTFPIPPYGPVCTNSFTPGPAYPDNYAPGIAADSMYDTDTYAGFSGGDVAPSVPGSRFRVFDTH
jgi:putative exosortase-associated protein (TIGR04073 family)